jgi:hypothetical protein
MIKRIVIVSLIIGGLWTLTAITVRATSGTAGSDDAPVMDTSGEIDSADLWRFVVAYGKPSIQLELATIIID